MAAAAGDAGAGAGAAAAEAAAGAGDARSFSWLRVCSSAELASSRGRFHFRVVVSADTGEGRVVAAGSGVEGGEEEESGAGGRHVSVLDIPEGGAGGGGLFAMDSICYHAGGPLTVGDIEDVNGHPCVVCPWHHYKVSCDTGEKWYQAAKFIDGKLTPSGWESVGQRQRVHDVRRNAETGDIEVRLRTGGECQSDKYATDDACAIRTENAVGADGKLGGGRSGRRPSGHVVAQARESGMLRMPGASRPPQPGRLSGSFM